MSDTILLNVYRNGLKAWVADGAGAREVMVLGPDLKPRPVQVPGPVCRVRLHSSRAFRVDPDTGKVQVATHQNNPRKGWLNLCPVWDRTGVWLRAILDERGTDVRFELA